MTRHESQDDATPIILAAGNAVSSEITAVGRVEFVVEGKIGASQPAVNEIGP